MASPVHRAGMEPVPGTAAISVIANRKKRAVPIFPSTLAEHDPDHQPDQPTAPYDFPIIPSRMPLGQRYETALPASKRAKYSAGKKLPGKVPDKSAWVTPEALQKKGSRPPIFANHRQEICETLQYFRSYHAGLYKRQGIAYGCLLDGYSALGDVFADNGKVIITHAGGGSVPVSAPRRNSKFSTDGSYKGRRMQLGQSESRESDTIRSLFHCLEHSIPLVLIAGEKYSFMPCLKSKYGVAYAVMGFYLVTHGWAERDCKTQNLIRFKFRFQWLSSQGEPWWTGDVEGNASAVTPSSTHTPIMEATAPSQRGKVIENEVSSNYSCQYCGTESARIYRIRNFCLNENCIQFFQKLNRNHQQMAETEWKYSDWVLSSQKYLEKEHRVPYQLIPSQVLQNLAEGQHIEPSLKGIYCTDCGRITRRIFWDLFNCGTCDKTHKFTKQQRESVFGSSKRPPNPNFENWFSKASEIDHRYISSVEGWTAMAYYLPQGGGTVIHARRQSTHLEIADKLMRQYQYKTGGELFRRNKLKTSRDLGMVGQQFTLNCGTPYRFSTEATTICWDKSPKVVVAARQEIQTAVSALFQDPLCRSEPEVEFNQILSCGYVAATGMKYHSDDEIGVGPVVVSLSLGSSAVMSFRRVTKSTKPEVTKPRGMNTPNGAGTTPIGILANNRITEPESSSKRPLNRSCLTLQLLHGDIVIQSGKEVQHNWQHSIKAHGPRIGVTARHLTS